MAQSFTVKFHTKTIFKSKICEVTQVLIGEESIGYIAEDYRQVDEKGNPAVSKFNAEGLMTDPHCAGCAAEELFSSYVGLPRSQIKITSQISGNSLITSLIIADILKPSFKH